MKGTLFFVVALGVVAIGHGQVAPDCTPAQCALPNCFCSLSQPNLDVSRRPQLVMISLDEGIQEVFVNNFTKPAYFGRKNPNGCQIGATFFVPNAYTDYSKVHELWAKGFEIGSNSISKNYQAEYWKNADVALLRKEFGGQKQALQRFGGVPAGEVHGARIPNLQMAGDNTFDALALEQFVYDSSWPTRMEGVWPYTLDFKSNQDCSIEPCPVRAHKGFWELPLNDWEDMNGVACSTVAACQYLPDSQSDLLAWLKQNFNTAYGQSKQPFHIALNSAVFQKFTNFFAAYVQFLDYLATLKDVYIVNMHQAIEWMQKPKAKDDPTLFTCNPERPHDEKLTKKCTVDWDKPEHKLIVVYNTPCPVHYPTVDNPLGV